MPSKIRSRTSPTNSLLPGHNFKYQDLHLHLQRNCGKCKIGPSHQRPPRRRRRNWRNTARHCQRRSGNPFNSIRSRNGHVPWRMPRLHGHAHRPLVKNCEQSGCLLCSRVRGPVNLAGPLEILAKVWLHKKSRERRSKRMILYPPSWLGCEPSSWNHGRVTSLLASFLPFLLTSASK